MEVNFEIGLIPVLQKLDLESWADFREKWLAYQAREGDQPLRNLIVPHVVDMLKIQLDIEDHAPLPEDSAELLGRISALYAPRNVAEAVKRLEEVKQVKNTIEGITEFCSEEPAHDIVTCVTAPDGLKFVGTANCTANRSLSLQNTCFRNAFDLVGFDNFGFDVGN